MEFLDDEQLSQLSKEAMTNPLTDMEPTTDFDIHFNLDKVEALIIGLDRGELLNKLGYRRVALTHILESNPEQRFA